MKPFTFIFAIFLLTLGGVQSLETSAAKAVKLEKTDKDSNEALKNSDENPSDHDRKRSVHIPRPYDIRPPYSPSAPVQGFPLGPNVIKASLTYHQQIEGDTNDFISLNGFDSGPQSPQINVGPQQQFGEGFCTGQNPCVPIVYCAPFYEEVVHFRQGCPLGFNGFGACCREARRGIPLGASFDAPSAPSAQAFEAMAVAVSMPNVPQQVVGSAAAQGFAAFQNFEDRNNALQLEGVMITDPQRPEYGHLQFFRTTPRAVAVSNGALVQTFTGFALQQRLNLNSLQAGFGLQSIPTMETSLRATCPDNPICGQMQAIYRNIDASCNNLDNPKYGQALTPFGRLLPPRYADVKLLPRRSLTGRELPSARLISSLAAPDINRPSPNLALSVMQWGQFIDHDLTHSPIFRYSNDSGIECCDRNGQFIDATLRHPECFPISVPNNDPFYAQFGRKCLNFVRSRPAPRNNCTIGFREQMNQITHFLDGSAVYGSSNEESMDELRLGSGGLLKTQLNNLLPKDRNVNEEDCFLTGTGLGCFRAGDTRVNEQPHLSVVHTLWVRQHNRIANELRRLNPYWNDELLFQEARKIVAAQIQHIVFNEWLPLILGTETAENFSLLPKRQGFNFDYDRFLDPSIRNEFATIAFRFGHTLVEGMLKLFNENHQQTGSINLFENFNRPRLIYQQGNLDQMLRGLFKQPMQSFDNFVADDLTNRLFQTDEMPFGLDLIAFNIQRGRDHAVPSYNDLREFCGLRRARNFQDLNGFINPKSVYTFKSLYESVDDIDPFIGGISEFPVNGGVVGPLFNCIIRDQFIRLKFGDRFYYENGGMPSSFTEAQLFEIRKTSWAQIICANSDNIELVQPLAFRLPGPNNQKTQCSSPSIPKLDLTPWIRNTKSSHYHKK